MDEVALHQLLRLVGVALLERVQDVAVLGGGLGQVALAGELGDAGQPGLGSGGGSTSACGFKMSDAIRWAVCRARSAMNVSRRMRRIIPRRARAVPIESPAEISCVMADLKNPRLMYAKAGLVLVSGGLAATMLLFQSPTLRTAALLTLTIWSFARAYYFAFYVIEQYIDPGYRFAGLLSLARYLLRRRLRNL